MLRCAILCLCAASAMGLEAFFVDYDQDDKRQHFVLGVAAASTAMLTLEKIDPDAKPLKKFICGSGSAMLVGAIKEAADSLDKRHHTVDSKDFIATTTGGLCASVVFSWDF